MGETNDGGNGNVSSEGDINIGKGIDAKGGAGNDNDAEGGAGNDNDAKGGAGNDNDAKGGAGNDNDAKGGAGKDGNDGRGVGDVNSVTTGAFGTTLSYQCSDFDETTPSVTNIVSFKYTIETTDDNYDEVLPNLEAAMLDESYGAALTCLFLEKNSRNRKLLEHVYRVDSQPLDIRSVEQCAPLKKKNTCTVMNGQMELFLESENEIESARRNVVTAIQNSIEMKKF